MIREKIFHERIFEKLEGLFDKVIYEKKRGYESNPKPKIDDVDHIIKHYSSKCSMISLEAALKPGQLAVISTVPEIVLGMKKQSEMIYDIAVAYNKDNIMSKELLAGILFLAVYGESYGLLEYTGGKYKLYQSTRLLDAALFKITKRISRMLFRSNLVRWIPGFSTVSHALISGDATRNIGFTSGNILSKELEIIKFSGEENDYNEKSNWYGMEENASGANHGLRL